MCVCDRGPPDRQVTRIVYGLRDWSGAGGWGGLAGRRFDSAAEGAGPGVAVVVGESAVEGAGVGDGEPDAEDMAFLLGVGPVFEFGAAMEGGPIV